jgi:hypothetical protein
MVAGCDSKPLPDVSAIKGYTYLCHVSSASDGIFTFASVPTGQYVLVNNYSLLSPTYNVAIKCPVNLQVPYSMGCVLPMY